MRNDSKMADKEIELAKLKHLIEIEQARINDIKHIKKLSTQEELREKLRESEKFEIKANARNLNLNNSKKFKELINTTSKEESSFDFRNQKFKSFDLEQKWEKIKQDQAVSQNLNLQTGSF